MSNQKKQILDVFHEEDEYKEGAFRDSNMSNDLGK